MSVAMVAKSAMNDRLLMLLQLVFRWFRMFGLCRHGYLKLGVTLVGVLVIYLHWNLSSVVFDPSSNVSYFDPDSQIKYFDSDSQIIHSNILRDAYFKNNTVAQTPSPAEVERRKRVIVFSRIFHKRGRKTRKLQDQTQCIHPKLDLKHDANTFAFTDKAPLNCTGSGMFFERKGALVINSSVVKEPLQLGKCSFFDIKRTGDYDYLYEKPLVLETPPFEVRIEHDFVRICCSYKSTLERVKNQRLEWEKENEAFMGNDPFMAEADNYGIETEQTTSKEQVLLTRSKREANEYNDSMRFSDKGEIDNGNTTVNQDAYGYENAGFFEYGDGTFFNAYNNPEEDEVDFDQFLVRVHPKPEVFQRIQKIQSSRRGAKKLNVLMLGLDSMSHLSYQRKLPRTYEYLKEELGAVILDNYNIVGDATTAALIPMLTGMNETELPEVRSSVLDSMNVDEYPLVWKDFTEQGYATLFAEDEPTIATFNLRFNGFREPPADHYMRAFWQALEASSLRKQSERFCTGDTAHHRFTLGYVEDFFLKYRNVSRFAFGFHVELTHSDNDPGQYIDQDLRAMLHRLKKKKVLDDTVVVVFADHGARYSKVRQTVQGKLEERLPFMALALPPSFRHHHRHLHHNLHTNRQRLATPFDIHATLLDFMNLTRTEDPTAPDARGISLLREIPANRTCQSAGIGMHWCTCLHEVAVETDEEFVKPAALALVRHLNDLTAVHRDRCAELQLGEVHRANLIVPNEQVLKFKKSMDEDQRLANFSEEVNPDIVHYQLQVQTQPCGALYEATIMADFRNYTQYHYTVTPGISRINKYGSQPLCVQQKFPFLRQFCCCQDYLQEQENLEGLGQGRGSIDTTSRR